MHGSRNIKFKMVALRNNRNIRFGVPECNINFDTLDLFFGRPDDDDDDSVEWKNVAIIIFCVTNCCL